MDNYDFDLFSIVYENPYYAVDKACQFNYTTSRVLRQSQLVAEKEPKYIHLDNNGQIIETVDSPKYAIENKLEATSAARNDFYRHTKNCLTKLNDYIGEKMKGFKKEACSRLSAYYDLYYDDAARLFSRIINGEKTQEEYELDCRDFRQGIMASHTAALFEDLYNCINNYLSESERLRRVKNAATLVDAYDRDYTESGYKSIFFQKEDKNVFLTSLDRFEKLNSDLKSIIASELHAAKVDKKEAEKLSKTITGISLESDDQTREEMAKLLYSCDAHIEKARALSKKWDLLQALNMRGKCSNESILSRSERAYYYLTDIVDGIPKGKVKADKMYVSRDELDMLFALEKDCPLLKPSLDALKSETTEADELI